jgi:hypothetical protein
VHPLRVGVLAAPLALGALFSLGCSSGAASPEATASSASHVSAGAGVTASAAGAKLVTVARATLFAEPKKKATVVRTLAVGIEVTAVGDAPQNGFVHVTVSDDEGWLMPSFLQTEDASETAPAPSTTGGAGPTDDPQTDQSGPTAPDDPNGTTTSTGGLQGTGQIESCQASFYAEGQQTASGEPFDPNALTAAHKTLPFGTMVRVTNTGNGQTVDVEINDRGPFVAKRCIDLSKAAFDAIADESAGVADVTVEVLQ